MSHLAVIQDAGAQAPASSWGLQPGDDLTPGRTVLHTLGGGRLFEALLVWDDRRFAILVAKLLRPDRAGDPHALSQLRREAEALDRLSHPVLVRGFEVVLDGPRPHLVLEHLEGATLRSILKRGGPLVQQQLLPLALHLAAALHYLEAEGWVHLDVKPDNIVMGIPPRLIDLSLARPIERARELHGPAGTDAYMAPEQCDPIGHPGGVGPAADVFGLCATLFQALTDRVPFPRPKGAHESPDPAVRFPQLHAEPSWPQGRFDPALVDLLTRGLSRDPALRPRAAELAAGLEPLVDALPRRLVLSRRGARGR